MQKQIQKISLAIFATLISGSLFISTASATSFIDLYSTDRNFFAIEYLAQNGIINGYTDGSFRQDHTITRAEFLKIALGASKVTLDVTDNTNFTDVDEQSWYAPFVRKAKKEGWIQGYTDNTFRPNQEITRAEGVKIIATVQKWQLTNPTVQPFIDTPLDQWFTTYIDYAKSKNFLEQTGSIFIPNAQLTRANTSEILFRTLITANFGAFGYSTDLQKNVVLKDTTPQITAPNFTPVVFQTVPSNFFTNISLSESVPNTYYLNEIYSFEGNVTSGTYSSAFIFIKDETDLTYTNNVGNITNRHFNIPVVFRKPGNYKLGLILGNSGQSKTISISVLPSLPKPIINSTSQTPTSFNLDYLNLQTTLLWNHGVANNLTQISFTQGNITKNYFSRQNKTSFDIQYQDFKDFNEGGVTIQIQSAISSQTKPLNIQSDWSIPMTANLNVTTHNFVETHPDQITYNQLPEVLSNFTTITFNGKTNTDIFQEASIITPYGNVESINLQTSQPTSKYYDVNYIPSGNNYVFSYLPRLSGTYFIEINGTNGQAVLNIPVYINTGIPLIPDFFDLNKDVIEPTDSLDSYRNILLNYINISRAKASLSPIILDTALNSLAQNYSNDMVNRNFFSHINPEGKTPNDRRIDALIPTEVGENLARSPSIAYSHFGLMRSAIHRKNILDPAWTRVGLGLTRTSENYLDIVEEFSNNPLTPADLLNIKFDVLNKINQKRSAAGVSLITIDNPLSQVADDWSQAMVDQNFFSFNAPNGTSLSQTVQSAAAGKTVQAYILESNNAQKLIDEILKNTEIINQKWLITGLGLKMDNIGNLKFTLLLSTT